MKITFFCWMYNNFCSDFLLYDVIDFVRMYKSIVESCIDKTFPDRLSSFERCWSSLLRLLMELRRSLLRIDQACLLETFGSLKIRHFGYTNFWISLMKLNMISCILLVLLLLVSMVLPKCTNSPLVIHFLIFKGVLLWVLLFFLH